MNKRSVNKAIIVGRVGEKPEARKTASDRTVVTLSVATNESFKTQDGNWKETTEWHRVVAWGKQAEFIDQYIQKGQLVYIDGRIQTRKWQDKNNMDRYTTEIMSDTITALDWKDDNPSNPAEPQNSAPAANDGGDDLPF